MFEIEGDVEKIHSAARITHLRLKTGGEFTKYLDVKMFRPVNDVGRGDRVRITGDLGNTKLDGYQERGKDGRMYDKRVTELIGRDIEVLGPGQGRIPGTEPSNDNRSRNDDGDKVPF